MKSLLIIATVLLLGNASRAQTKNIKKSIPNGFKICMAEITGDTIRTQAIFNDPVLHLCGADFHISGADVNIISYDLSWTIATGKDPDFYNGPYTITGPAISAAALSGMKASAAQSRITRIYIENIRGSIPGQGSRRLSSKFYKVVE